MPLLWRGGAAWGSLHAPHVAPGTAGCRRVTPKWLQPASRRAAGRAFSPTPSLQQVPFNLDSMVAHVEHIMQTRGHAVVCMAEGAGKVRAQRSHALDPVNQSAALESGLRSGYKPKLLLPRSA